MATDEEKHLEVMTAIKGINTTIKKVLEPAVEQTYKNEKEIIKIKSFQSVTKYLGGLMTTIVMFITLRSIWDWIKHH